LLKKGVSSGTCSKYKSGGEYFNKLPFKKWGDLSRKRGELYREGRQCLSGRPSKEEQRERWGGKLQELSRPHLLKTSENGFRKKIQGELPLGRY